MSHRTKRHVEEEPANVDGAFSPADDKESFPSRMLALGKSPAIWIAIVLIAGSSILVPKLPALRHARATAGKSEAAANAAKSERADAAKEAKAERANSSAITQNDLKEELNAYVAGAAKKLVGDGFIAGPIGRVTCTPVGGGSAADQTQRFDCFAVNKENGDGTESGVTFDGTIDYKTGAMQWQYRAG